MQEDVPKHLIGVSRKASTGLKVWEGRKRSQDEDSSLLRVRRQTISENEVSWCKELLRTQISGVPG